PEIAQRHDDLVAPHAAREVPRIQSGGTVQGGLEGRDAGHFPPLADPTDDRRVPRGGPGGAYARPKRVTRLVHEGNRTPWAPSPLYIRNWREARSAPASWLAGDGLRAPLRLDRRKK